MSIRISVVTTLVVLTGCRAPKPEPSPFPPPSGAPVRLELAPAAVLVPVGQTHALTVKAFTADGAEVDPGEVTWVSSRPEFVAVDASGVVTGVAVGSAQVTAKAGALSASALALTAQLVPGAVTVTDAQLGRRVEPVDGTTPYGRGFRYRVELVGVTPPAPGSILVASEAAPVAGRVVEVSGQTVTLEVVPVSEVFAAIELHETFTNLSPEVPQRTQSHVTSTTHPNGSTTWSVKQQPLEFELGPFDCEVEGPVAPRFTIEQADFTLTNDPTYEVEFTRARQRLILRDAPQVDVTLKPALRADLEVALECKLQLFKREIPVPGPVGIFFGATVLAGVGFGLEAKTPLGDGVSVLMTGQVKGRVRAGVDCTDFSCTPIREVEVDRSTGTFTPKADVALPTTLPRVDVTADVFAYVDVKAGVTILRRFDFDTPRDLEMDVVGSKLGLRAKASIATEARQAQERFYSSSYELLLHGEVKAGKNLGRLLALLGAALGVSFEVQDLDVQLAVSPKATVQSNQRTFLVGETVRFDVKFDPATISFPLVDHNLEKVRLLKVVRPADGGTDVTLVPMAEQLAQPGVTDFTLSGVATQDSSASDYVVFATSRLWTSLSLEQEERCSMPAGYSYCVEEKMRDFSPLRRFPNGRVWGHGGSTGYAIWEEGKPLVEIPKLTFDGPQDHNALGQTLYFESAPDNVYTTFLMVDGMRGKTINGFLGRILNARGQIIGFRVVPDSMPGAEDGYSVPAFFDGMSIVDLPFIPTDISDTGVVLGGSGDTYPGGRLPGTDVTTSIINPTGTVIAGSDGPVDVVWRNRVQSPIPLSAVRSIDSAGRILGASPQSPFNASYLLELDGGMVDLKAASYPPQAVVACMHLSDDGVLSCVTTPTDGGADMFSLLVPGPAMP